MCFTGTTLLLAELHEELLQEKFTLFSFGQKQTQIRESFHFFHLERRVQGGRRCGV